MSVVSGGSPSPLGVTPTATGVNIAVFSAYGERIEFCLFDPGGEREIARIALPERTGDIHHGHIEGIASGALYGLRVHGPYDPARGHRFNPHKLLVDPYALALHLPFSLSPTQFGAHADTGDMDRSDSAYATPKGIVSAPLPAPSAARPAVPLADSILYELNIRGFTKLHPDVPEAQRGTFAALAHPAVIAHLRNLGVTAIEAMPAMAWIDERHLPALGLTNAWGYNPVVFGVPDPRLAPGGWAEVRDTIAALHDAGLEFILDVVLNHSGESDELGPTLSFRGLDNASYYRLDPADPARYINDMGCGNCLALNRPHVVDLAMDGLRRWARAGVDGFRFDLAPALGREETGFSPSAPLITTLGQDPELAPLKLIAEPWDIGPGGYQLGRFPARWAEWNDRYRDTARRFWRGDAGQRGDMATRLTGSADVFGHARRPARSVNFITAHDGFTLADLVSHTEKHNHANGENNRDGGSDNHSWNHGTEGESNDPATIAARLRDQKNLIATLLFSRGTPMLAMGAEMGHSQRGNNNAYAQDNATTWLDWSAANPDLLTTTQTLTALRRAHPLLRDNRFLSGSPDASGLIDAQWLRPDGQPMSGEHWNDAHSQSLILLLSGPAEQLAIVLNPGGDDVDITLPALTGKRWSRAFDTAGDGASGGQIAARSVVLFVAQARNTAHAPTPETLAALSSECGIAPTWWDHAGTLHHVNEDSQRALLKAMGLEVGSENQTRDALMTLRACRHDGLPETAYATEGHSPLLMWSAERPTSAPPAHLQCVADDGTIRDLKVRASPLTPRTNGGWHGPLHLPPLPRGRYRLLDPRKPMRASHLTVAPARCHLPRNLPRSFGLSAQLYSLRSAQDQGIGDFGTLALAARAAAQNGAATFGINPLHALFGATPERASPYHPSDRRFLDPLMIDLNALQGLPESTLSASLMQASLPAFEQLKALKTIDYRAVAGLKSACLNARHEVFRASGATHPLWVEFQAFIKTGGEALKHFAIFRALEQHHAGTPWQNWGQHADVASAAVAHFAAAHEQQVEYEMFCQWLADRQLAAAAHNTGLGIGLYRDLAVGCAPDGGEAWATPLMFAQGVSVGAPPDPFSAEGQNWCLPPPNPLTMGQGGFAGFRALLAANMRHAGMLRIDHVMALTRLFWVPDGARTADGAYVTYPRDALLAEIAFESRAANCMVVGEDLGTVPDGFRPALEQKGILTYRVLWFERQGERFTPAHEYPEQAIACVSTHDLPPLAGWWSGADVDEDASLGRLNTREEADQRRASEKHTLITQLIEDGYLEHTPVADGPLDDATAAALHAFIADTPAHIAFAQADDLAGEAIAVNLPGTDKERPNWQRRLDEPVETLFTTPRAMAILSALRRLRPQ